LIVGVGYANWFLFFLFLVGALIPGVCTFVTWEGFDLERFDLSNIIEGIRGGFPEFF
jgi:hypothetical protein